MNPTMRINSDTQQRSEKLSSYTSQSGQTRKVFEIFQTEVQLENTLLCNNTAKVALENIVKSEESIDKITKNKCNNSKNRNQMIFQYQLLKSIQIKPHFQLNNILSKCVLSDFTKPPTISQIQTYTIKEFHHFEEIIKEFSLNGDIQTYMILIQTTCHLAGCYYPKKALLKHSILFACDSEKHEEVPFVREYQPVKLRQSENYVNEVVLRQREFEFNKDGVVVFRARNTNDEIKYMSIITFNQ